MFARWVLWVVVTALLFGLGCSQGGIVAPESDTTNPGEDVAGAWVHRTSEPTSWTELKEMYRQGGEGRPPKDNE